MITKKPFTILGLSFVLIGTVFANDKKIRLEDIEQDNLNSERVKDGRNNEIHPQQTRIQYVHKHQYDVEEPEMPKPPKIVYAMKSNNFHSTGQRYMDIKRERERIQAEKATMYQSASNERNPTGATGVHVPPANYIPMQVIYVPQYDPSASNHINAYAQQYQQVVEVPYYYQVGPQQETSQEYNPNEQKYYVKSPHVNYVTVEVPEEQQQAVEEPRYHQVQSAEKSRPFYQNYVGYVQQQAYTNGLVEDQGHAEEEQEVVPKYEQVQHPKQQTISVQSLSPIRLGPTPQVLPQYAHEVSRPVYSHISGNLVKDTSQVSAYDSKDGVEDYKLKFGEFVRRKPTSLLESYIPSSIQLEYLRRGLSKEPLATYDAVAHSQGFPAKNFETGFLPNSMYPTAGGGVTYGHFKRQTKNNSA